ncbi:sigma-70 family RNA polymerase sigma factor [Paenibacillus sp. FSL R7-0297]|uniref:terminase gpP N-terminus-related DNA-binding protein n=1 Tax=unclassified Paenibacillus TaxID=185978 RepID=UPI0009E095E9
MIEQLTEGLPAFEKSILYNLYLKGYSEAEVAKQFNMSQQAVSKWKKKIIHASWNQPFTCAVSSVRISR